MTQDTKNNQDQTADQPVNQAAPQQTQAGVEHAPKRKSVWTKKQRIIRALWGTLGRALWITIPPARSSILRLFGGTVGKRCALARDIDIVVPWNIHLGNDVSVANHAILYSLGTITIGDHCVIDSKAHLCAGTHDMTDPLFPLLRPPITLGNNCFVGFDAYIGPDTTLAPNTIVHPRSSVYRSTQPTTAWKGNPAKQVDHPNQPMTEQADQPKPHASQPADAAS